MRRKLADAVIAAVSAWAVPLAYLVWSSPAFDSSGHPDNAPYLAKGLLIYLTPAILVLLLSYFLALPSLLSRLSVQSLPAFLSAACLVAVAVSIALYRSELSSAGPEYAAQQAAILGGLLFLVLATGEVVRWLRQRAAA